LFGSISIPDLIQAIQPYLPVDFPGQTVLDVRWAAGEVEAGRVDPGDKVRKLGRYSIVLGVKGDKEGVMQEEREVEVVPANVAVGAGAESGSV
jgi:sulfate adenylyltransferase subunit 1 (EFTu-like GTPase family)